VQSRRRRISRRHAERALKAHRRIGRHAPLPVDDLVEAWLRDPDLPRELDLRDIERLEELFEEHLAGGRRATVFAGRLVVVGDLDLHGFRTAPDEAHAVLLVDTDGVLTSAREFGRRARRLTAIPDRNSTAPEASATPLTQAFRAHADSRDDRAEPVNQRVVGSSPTSGAISNPSVSMSMEEFVLFGGPDDSVFKSLTFVSPPN
jgi:hypothetical protein